MSSKKLCCLSLLLSKFVHFPPLHHHNLVKGSQVPQTTHSFHGVHCAFFGDWTLCGLNLSLFFTIFSFHQSKLALLLTYILRGHLSAACLGEKCSDIKLIHTTCSSGSFSWNKEKDFKCVISVPLTMWQEIIFQICN